MQVRDSRPVDTKQISYRYHSFTYRYTYSEFSEQYPTTGINASLNVSSLFACPWSAPNREYENETEGKEYRDLGSLILRSYRHRGIMRRHKRASVRTHYSPQNAYKVVARKKRTFYFAFNVGLFVFKVTFICVHL